MSRMVELLITKGANVNAQNESGKTAIMLAAFAGKLNIIKELRNNEASYDLRDRAGCTVLHYAVDGGNLDSVKKAKTLKQPNDIVVINLHFIRFSIS